MSSSKFSRELLKKQLKDINKSSDLGFSVGLIDEFGDWGWGIGDWGLGIGPNPQSPIPNPQSPIPI